MSIPSLGAGATINGGEKWARAWTASLGNGRIGTGNRGRIDPLPFFVWVDLRIPKQRAIGDTEGQANVSKDGTLSVVGLGHST
jgi:hypothetical protein